MPRNRVIYNSESLFVGPSPATGAHFLDFSTFGATTSAQIYNYNQSVLGNGNTGVNLINQLTRVQNISYDFNIPRQDVFQYGELGALDRLNLEPPTVSLNFTYLLSSFNNEKYLGFQLSTPVGASDGTTSSCLRGFIAKTQDEKNYFIKTAPVSAGDLNDYNSTAYTGEVIGIGNAFITNYTSEGAVGDFPRVSVSVEGINMKWDQITANDIAQPRADTGVAYIPAVNPIDGSGITTLLYSLPKAVTNATGTLQQVTAFKHGDIRFSLINYNEGGASINDAKIQSYSLNIPMSRTAISKLGTQYPYSRELNFPITATLSVNAIVGDLTTGTLTEIVRNNNKYNASVFLLPKGSTSTPSSPFPLYWISGMTLDGQSFSSDIGSNKSVTLNFSIPMGGDSNICFSGVYNNSF